MARISPRVLAAFIAVASLKGDQKKLTMDQRVELLRGLNSEYATVKAPLPRSKKPLEFNSDGTWDKEQWLAVGKQMGPAARIGDLVQITHVSIENDRILFEINNGLKNSGIVEGPRAGRHRRRHGSPFAQRRQRAGRHQHRSEIP